MDGSKKYNKNKIILGWIYSSQQLFNNRSNHVKFNKSWSVIWCCINQIKFVSKIHEHLPSKCTGKSCRYHIYNGRHHLLMKQHLNIYIEMYIYIYIYICALLPDRYTYKNILYICIKRREVYYHILEIWNRKKTIQFCNWPSGTQLNCWTYPLPNLAF